MYKRHLALAALTASLLLGGTALSTAHAEDGPPPPESGAPHEPPPGGPEGGPPDRDGPGNHGDRGAKMFEEADKNKDGVLTKEEMLEAHKTRIDDMFEKLDTNKNGNLSKEELAKGREEMRKKMKERFKDRAEKRGEMKDNKGGDKPE